MLSSVGKHVNRCECCHVLHLRGILSDQERVYEVVMEGNGMRVKDTAHERKVAQTQLVVGQVGNWWNRGEFVQMCKG